MPQDPTRLAVIGASSLKHGIPIIFSLANYFGETPIESIFWDPEEERLDLFDLLARKSFQFTQNTQILRSSTDAQDVFDFEPNRWIVAMEPRMVKRATHSVQRLLKPFVENPPVGQVINLMEQDVPWLGRATNIEWKPIHDYDSVPHQVLRWINGEEYLVLALREYEQSPFHEWLDNREGKWPNS